jgi:hypothetical protein
VGASPQRDASFFVCVWMGAVDAQPKLRKLLQKGDYFLGAVLASTLTKLALRTQELHGAFG